MVINFTDIQLMGLKAAYDKCVEGMTFDAYVELICQELAQSMINKFVKSYTQVQTAEAEVKLNAAGIVAPMVVADNGI